MCSRCPCPNICPELKVFCEWASQDPPNPIHLSHICNSAKIKEQFPSLATQAASVSVSTKAQEQFPSLATQAASAALAVGRFIGSGFATTSSADQATRRAICNSCDRFDKGTCRECGCIITLKIKMASEACPLGRWESIMKPVAWVQRPANGCGSCGKP